MNGVHDLGGADGLGPVSPPPDEPIFHAEWEKRVFAMFIPFAQAGLNLDQFRSGIEQMHPVEYLTGRYYEHWLYTIEKGLLAKGVIDRDELEARTRHYLDNPDAPLPEREDPEQIAEFLEVYRGVAGTTRRDSDDEPRFAEGQRVRVRNSNPTSHTRSARYLRGKSGVIERVYETFVFPDTNAREEGENPVHVYNVRFTASDVWGEPDGEQHTILFDLWEPYLEAAVQPKEARAR
jgi:nitrile hydratase